MPEVAGLTAIYLFCFARSACLPEIAGKSVDGGSPLFVLHHRDIAAVVGKAPLDEFQGDLAESGMCDIEWVGPRACRHERVVEEVMRRSPVLPARFGTVFLSLEGLESRMRMHRDSISAFLDLVCDTEEWSVKGLMDREKAVRKHCLGMLEGRAKHHSLRPGTRYLEQQRLQAVAEQEFTNRLKEAGEGVARDLSRIAIDWAVRKTLPRKVMGGERTMVLNWAFLVPRKASTDFFARIERANADFSAFELVFDLSGPWPPYSFCPFLEAETTT